ncbi:MAG: hypothetical protein Q4C42_10805 [Clostridia bacterium]|nr:hypothetical protein [Clostridia bacterium]
MALTFPEVLELKKAVDTNCSAYVHFHDACGGQYFTLDETNEELRSFIKSYFAELSMTVDFSEDGMYFTVK